MKERLLIHMSYNQQQSEYSIDYNLQQNIAKVQIRSLLKLINIFLNDKDIVITNYLNIYVVTPNGKENIFKLKKNNTHLNLILNQNGAFSIKIILQDIQDKQNLLKFFHTNSQQYTRISNNINRIIQQSKQQQKKRGQKCIRPIDIAYFFADPLVAVSKNKIIIKHQVSYQIQYDKFIELVKKQKFDKNFRIEMMVATKSNIKNTLFDGASILHFACHGKKPNGNLQIESQTSIGELEDLQHSQFMSLLDIGAALPKLIIFNVCYSHHLAKMISSSKKILTIGYNDEASDYYCEVFTRQFYMGLFKNKQPIRQLFYKIKAKIVEKDQKQGNKLCIFPEEPFQNEDNQQFFQNTQSKTNYFKKWTFLENMRENDNLGVKSEMFTFIKQYLTSGDVISYFLLRGQKYSGKSDFMKKTRIYVMNRKVFTDQFIVDLKHKEGRNLDTLLQFRLQKQFFIDKKMAQLKQFFKQRRIKPIIIFDHTQKLLKLQYGRFIDYIQNKLIKPLKHGKIIIITNNITPIKKQDAEAFKKAHFHLKEKPNIEESELLTYIKRYASQDIKDPASKYVKARCYPFLKLVKAVKRSRSQRQFSQYCQSEQIISQQQLQQFTNLNFIRQKIRQFEKILNQLHSCANIKIQQNDYIFLSTIFWQIKLDQAQHYTNASCTYKQMFRHLQNLTQQFMNFIKNIFKAFRKQQSKIIYMKQYYPILQFLHISLKIAAFTYIYKDARLFERHLLNCQKIYILISDFYVQQLKKKDHFQQQIIQYHLRVLLALYSYYSQNEYCFKNKNLGLQRISLDDKQNNSEQLFHRKSKIIIDEINIQFDKNEYRLLYNTLKSLFTINNMAQQLHYNRNYNLFVESEQRNRRPSQILELSNDQQIDPQQQANKIDQHHQKIIQYWKTFKDIQRNQKNQRNDKNNKYQYLSFLRKQSIILMEILIIKQIVYNIRQLQIILQKGQSFLNQNINLYIDYYLQIMHKIYQDGIFNNKIDNILFHHHSCQAIKQLFQQYLKAYIQNYFKLSKIKQNINKQYNINIYQNLLDLCHISQYISGISSIKKMIQLHLNQQFYNTWTCTVFISLPIIYKKGQQYIKYNIKRYQNHIYNFINNYYNNQLDKQIKLQFKNINQNIIKHQQQQKRYLIQLIICDFIDGSQKMLLEDNTGISYPQSIKNISLPNARVIIYFGINVKIIQKYYNFNKCIVIWINIDQQLKNKQKQKQKNIIIMQQYNKKLGIYYNILQYFYCSFCRHFFNSNHTYFIQQQVKNSYDIAKYQTMIKIKILYSTNKQFHTQKQIQYIINQIDTNLHYLLNSKDGPELKSKAAYHFIYKQNKIIQYKKSNIDIPRTWQLGCNKQIYQLLTYIHNSINRDNPRKEIYNILIYYKSQPMLYFFLNTLKIKIKKQDKIIIIPQITINTYNKYHEQKINELKQSKQHKILSSDNQYQSIIIPFLNLQKSQIINQIKYLQQQYHTTFKLFFNKQIQSIQNFNKKIIISQTYKSNRQQYQLYYLYCKTLKNNLTQKKLKKIYQEIIKLPSTSLQDIKNSIQRL